MGGWGGVGGSSEKTDRGAQLGARQGMWNVFNWALPEGQEGQTAGQETLGGALKPLGQAQQYFSNLLTAGRTQTAERAAPAIQAATAQSDATRREAATMGTGRVGGTAAIQREAGAATTKTIDDIINETLVGGRAAGAQGLVGVSGVQAEVGAAQLRNSLSLLGLGEDAIKSIMENATRSRALSEEIGQRKVGDWRDAISRLLMAGAGAGG